MAYPTMNYAQADDSISFNLSDKCLDSVDIDTSDSDVFFIVDEMPKFQDGEWDEFRNYLAMNIHFSDSALEEGLCGTIYFSFVIDEQGNLGDIEVIRSCSPAIEAEIRRVLKSSPPWTPGKQRGKAVKVKFTFPLRIHWQ